MRPSVERNAPGEHVPLWSDSTGLAGLMLILLVGLVEMPLVHSFQSRTGELGRPPWGIPHVIATTLLPALVMVLGDRARSRGLYGFGLVWLVLAGGLSAVGGLVTCLGDPRFGVIPLFSGGLTLVSAKMMDSTKAS
jgi:hypothetical protein